MWRIKQSKTRESNKRKRVILSMAAVFVLTLLSLFGYYLARHTIFKSAAFVSPLPLDVFVDKSDSDTKRLEDLLRKNNVQFVTVSSSDASILVTLSSGEEILFSSQKNLELQISSLQLILSRLTIEGKKFTRLDFRFDKPVITLK